MNYKIWPWFFKIPGYQRFGATVLGRLVIFRSERQKELLWGHEMIHIKQMDRYTVVGFYLVYFYHWLRGMIKYRGDSRKAYRQNPLEKEAYGDK